MSRSMTNAMWIATCFAALLFVADVRQADAADCGYSTQQLDLFYNYYVGTGCGAGECGAAGCGGGLPARMYLAPRPTPPWVGHTYFTYQPLMPHEFLYKHHRTYIRQHPDGSATRTRVTWY